MQEENDDKVYVGLEKVLLKSEREEKRKNTKRIIVTVILCVLFLVVGFAGGFIYTYMIHPINQSDRNNTFGEIEAILEKEWIYANDYDDLQTELENKAFYGMTAFEEDPFTTYMSQDELNDFADNINMDYVGIGVQYAINNDKAIIERVFTNSPAEDAGLQSGDIIEKVDGISINGMGTDEIKSLVIGEANTKVVITITRNNETFDVAVIRGAIDNSVYCYAQDDYVVMELSSFGSSTGEECMKYLDQYANYEKIIIDLRDNTGGYQISVKEIAGLFIGDGEVYLRQKNSRGVETSDLTSCKKTYRNFNKYVLLVNENTASAAEVFTICLKEQLDDVTIVGTTTYGKGVIQSTNYLLGGGVLKYTSYNWYSPNGVSINKTGIMPDIEVKLPEFAYEYYKEMSEDEVYKYDSVSDITKVCQMGLELLGYNIDRTDGYFDKNFETALIQFENINGLENDGILDKEAYEMIVSQSVYELSQEENDTQFIEAVSLIQQ